MKFFLIFILCLNSFAFEIVLNKYKREFKTSKEILFYDKNSSNSDRTLKIIGGEPPFKWSAEYGKIEFIVEDGTEVTYFPSAINENDKLRVEDNTNEVKFIEVNLIKDLLVTPQKVFLFPKETTKFKVVSGNYPVNLLITGDADIINDKVKIEENSSDVYIKASSIAEDINIKFFDNAGKESIKNFNVVKKLRVSPQILYIDEFENKTFKAYGGIKPYRVIVTSGDINIDESDNNNSITKSAKGYYTPEKRYVDSTITIYDALGQEVKVIAKSERMDKLMITPSQPSINIGESVKLKAIKGTGNYEWNFSGGNLDKLSGEEVTFTAPNYSGIYYVSVSDSAENSKTIAIEVLKDILYKEDFLYLVLDTNWYLVTLPDFAHIKNKIFKDTFGDEIKLFKFEDGKWLKYSKDTDEIKMIDVGEGFWIKSDTPQNIKIPLSNYLFDLQLNTQELFKKYQNLDFGWHLIGTPIDLSASTILNLIGTNELWYYNGFEASWKMVDKNSSEIIYGGLGFWVNKKTPALNIEVDKSYILKDEILTLKASGGFAPYEWIVEDEDRNSTNLKINDTMLEFSANTIKDYNIYLKDTKSNLKSVKISVYNELKVDSNELNIKIGENKTFEISGGISPYQLTTKWGELNQSIANENDEVNYKPSNLYNSDLITVIDEIGNSVNIEVFVEK